MRRRLPLALSVLLTMLVSDHGCVAQTHDGSSHRIRPTSRRAAGLLALAIERSDTVRQQIDEIERSDLIVYIQLSPSFRFKHAVTRLIGAGADARFLMVSVNTLQRREQQIELLGHELQHVLEIAGARWVRDQESLRRLYQRIADDPGGWYRFETVAAQRAAADVRRDLMQARSPLEPTPQ